MPSLSKIQAFLTFLSVAAICTYLQAPVFGVLYAVAAAIALLGSLPAACAAFLGISVAGCFLYGGIQGGVLSLIYLLLLEKL